MLEKTFENPLDCREIQPVHPKGDRSWVSIERTDFKAVTPIFGHLMQRADSFERLKAGGERDNRGGDGVGDGQGGLACCGPWGHKESDMTE